MKLIRSSFGIFLDTGYRWYFESTSEMLCFTSSGEKGGFNFRRLQVTCWNISLVADASTQKLARPLAYTSSPLSFSAVSPKYMPILLLRLAKVTPELTSVQNPILASGMAKTVPSEASLNAAQLLSPTPPPMMNPFQLATCTTLLTEILQSRANYSLKKISRSRSVACPSQSTLTSPPAQNDLPPAPSSQYAGQCCSA